MFDYDHSLLSMDHLHKNGIRSSKEIEEVIEGHSFAEEVFLPELGYTIFRFIGFTKATKPIKLACRFDITGRLVTLDALIPKVEEIIEDFCRYC